MTRTWRSTRTPSASTRRPTPPTVTAPFNPDLGKYQVILSNYNGEAWPAAVQKSLDDGLKEGKFGLVIVHAADNSFPNWDEYNHMIGLGWRDAKAIHRKRREPSARSSASVTTTASSDRTRSS